MRYEPGGRTTSGGVPVLTGTSKKQKSHVLQWERWQTLDAIPLDPHTQITVIYQPKYEPI